LNPCKPASSCNLHNPPVSDKPPAPNIPSVPVVKAKYEPREYLEQVVYQRQVDYGGYRTRQACMGSKDIVSCDGSYHVKMYWFDW